jgi:1,4-dihydroxy-2-naphthoyl-CoA hydrolase
MAIWFKKDITVTDFQNRDVNTMSAHLGIVFTEIGEDYLCAKMPVDNRTRQIYGILHGGASAALAETVGSVASSLVVNRNEYKCVGLEINANHVRSVKEGFVVATCKPLHLGRQTHVWDIKIHDEQTGKLVCISRLTVAVLPIK